MSVHHFPVGYPSRDKNLDVLKGFINPPDGYGVVSFYWWLGDPLTKERIEWQLNRLKDKGITGLQVNYANSDSGGPNYGLTYPSEPPLFSDEWWRLYSWFLKEAQKRGMSVSLSDYTLGLAGQGWYIDEIIQEKPSIAGFVLECNVKDCTGKTSFELIANVISIMAYKIQDGNIAPDSVVDLRANVNDNILHWQAPGGNWRIAIVSRKFMPLSLDPMNPLSGAKVIEKFFQRFEDRYLGECGRGLNYFFSDELQFGIKGNLWNDYFAEEFHKLKGYDIIPELPALFMDVDARTPKIRLDYSDVLVDLEEKHYFRPIYEWHDKRGMLYGCDHGARGKDVLEFGDYFRTMRWMQCPGCDQMCLRADVIKNKVASSITHLYQRPRTWLEGYHSSGWGTNTAQLADATFRNFVMGHNLLTLHGLYYSTHGGWWEWAPPCNHFRMPYWEHAHEFLNCSKRLSYLLSQGVHCCDIAIIYPVASMEAGINGKESVDIAFELANYLFNRGIDFDFMDFQSLERSKVQDKELHVSDEKYRVLILPSMQAVRYSTIQKSLEFYRAGGVVIAAGKLPGASDRIGRDDADLDETVKEIFGSTAGDLKTINEIKIQHNNAGGMGIITQKPEQIVDVIDKTFPRDFVCLSDTLKTAGATVLHRRIGFRDVYMVYNASKNSECFFRAKGKVELWDPWSGKTRPLYVVSQTAEGTKVKMPLGKTEAQLIVFSPGCPSLTIENTDLEEIFNVSRENGKFMIQGAAVTPGKKTANIRYDDKNIVVTGEVLKPLSSVLLDGEWEFELKPTMDNCWGDYRLPAYKGMIGAEARRFRYADESGAYSNWQAPEFDDSGWTMAACSYGPYFWKLGPISDDTEPASFENEIINLRQVKPAIPVEVNEKRYFWKPYEFSMRFGVEDDPGHQGGDHGLKGKITEDFIALGNRKFPLWYKTSSVYEKENEGSLYYLWTSVIADHDMQARIICGNLKPARIWLNHITVNNNVKTVKLKSGHNILLLCYNRHGRTHFILESAGSACHGEQTYPLAMRWYNKPGVFTYDTRPQDDKPAGCYRFTSPPGLRSMTIISHGKIQAWANGETMKVELDGQYRNGSPVYKATVQKISPEPIKIAIRIEQGRGCYGGAALPEPIELDCVRGNIRLGDWSRIDGLSCYSGGALYRKTFNLSQEQIEGQVMLDLSDVVATAEVFINKKPAGIKVAPPWKFDISKLVKPGKNQIEILVYNTLANHYLTIPTRYRGALTSGLIGPVRIETKQIIQLT